MSFNPDPSKQAQKAIFSRTTKKEYHPPLAFNNNNVSETNSQKYLGAVLDNRLCFEDHLKIILNKVKDFYSTSTQTSKYPTKISRKTSS